MTDSLDAVAATFASTIVGALQQEYPNDLRHRMDHADDRPRPREIHPSFYGCYDWHSAVEMHWALARLVRHCSDVVPPTARAALNTHLTAERLAIEAAYFANHPGFSRPYGWGWAFALAADANNWDDMDARRWSRSLEPLTAALSAGFQRWLPNAEYPLRNGMHTNSAFGLARTWRWSQQEPKLRELIVDAAVRWFGDDRDYPANWEPSGADFLSPALAEAELMSMVLDGDQFANWFDGFMPTFPATLLTPVAVSDATDGQIAHLHGLNLHRAHGLRVVAAALGGNSQLAAAADGHLDASLPHVSGGDYMVEHWLAAYAVLALTGA